jgi:hypothetical protein
MIFKCNTICAITAYAASTNASYKVKYLGKLKYVLPVDHYDLSLDHV